MYYIMILYVLYCVYSNVYTLCVYGNNNFIRFYIVNVNLIVALACSQVVMESGHHNACSSRAQTDVEKQI